MYMYVYRDIYFYICMYTHTHMYMHTFVCMTYIIKPGGVRLVYRFCRALPSYSHKTNASYCNTLQLEHSTMQHTTLNTHSNALQRLCNLNLTMHIAGVRLKS